MITKERLEELIKEGATIYTSDGSDVHLNKYECVMGNPHTLCLFEQHRDYCEELYELRELFESEEDADFAEIYQNITRTETLNLPTWEEFNKLKEGYRFIGKDKIFYILCKKNNIIYLKWQEGDFYYEETYYDLTKKNYLKICEKCRKLFLGEEEK